jgi:hypothetical protein
MAEMSFCGRVGGAKGVGKILTVYLCPFKVNEFVVAGVNEAITLELVAVSAPASEPMKASVPEACEVLSVMVRANRKVEGVLVEEPNVIGVVESVEVT